VIINSILIHLIALVIIPTCQARTQFPCSHICIYIYWFIGN